NNEIINQYFLKDSSKLELLKNREAFAKNKNWEEDFKICLYRPFDWRHYYGGFFIYVVRLIPCRISFPAWIMYQTKLESAVLLVM
ncbi:MAG: hypothetical protein ACKO5Q_12435, partial [Microcystaceae cyanobacterium]